MIAIFTRQILEGQPTIIHWDGEQTRDYVFVKDVAAANLLAAYAGDGRCYCIGTGIGTSVNEIHQLVSEAVGVHMEVRREPRRPVDLRAAHFDPSRARRDLGWSASVALRDGLRRTVESFRAQLSTVHDGNP